MNEIPVPTKRFYIKIESDKPNLQDEMSLFEVNTRTTLKQFKQLIIIRLDQGQVTRTFFDQIKFIYDGEEIPNDFLTNSHTVISVLGVDDASITPTTSVFNLKLEVSNDVNGSNGILSRDFLRDLIADNRFEFSPKTNYDSELGEEINNENPIENLKIIDNHKEEWQLTGESYEKIINPLTRETKLIKQSELSDITYEIYDEGKKITLNTSQCLIIDNPKHQPYMLLNPSGIAKLSSLFNSQKVQILMFEDTPSETTNSQQQQQQQQQEEEPLNDDILDRLVITGRSLFFFVFKIAVALYFLGIKPNKHLKDNWIKYLILFIVLFNMYVMFCTGNNRIQNLLNPEVALNRYQPTTRSIVNTFRRIYGLTSNAGSLNLVLQNEIASILTRRTYDFEYILSSEPNWWIVINSNFENIWKDSMIYVLTILPSFQFRIYDELHKHKIRELELLETKISQFYDLMVVVSEEYNKDHDPSFNIPDQLHFEEFKTKIENMNETEFPDLSTSERNEIKYEYWVSYFKCLKNSFNVLNKVFVNKNFLNDEQVEYIDENFNRFINSRMQ
ncbi:hypothetical protein KGF54_000206 [Candida jiufengensis]|uniref:uncharacterized protein n=1 Tax=Candida jiufengensis TaxID=497108 RepID=UPI002225AF5C|nr:uncharacterized protein KGF54_000206 [Candida jiufengensis]KAI5957278.1 hypothetical protein KGF54_000206 [Candida jiufengensis]